MSDSADFLKGTTEESSQTMFAAMDTAIGMLPARLGRLEKIILSTLERMAREDGEGNRARLDPHKQVVGVSFIFMKKEFCQASGCCTRWTRSLRASLARARRTLREAGMIETYHMDRWGMVGKGRPNHICLTDLGSVWWARGLKLAPQTPASVKTVDETEQALAEAANA